MTLTQAACSVLSEPDPAEKVRLTFEIGELWRAGDIVEIGDTPPPDVPARPLRPELCNPHDMPKRSGGTGKRRTALIHAIAHIELNAIDLAWDAVARFVDEDLPKSFFDDWVLVAVDEAKHFELLTQRLSQLDAAYGDFPAHNGLWEAAEKTKHDVLERLALVPMILEARGLDTTPPTVERLTKNGDVATADIMDLIAREEIDHVRAGVTWFEYLCQKRALDPVLTFKQLLGKNFKGQLKPPFNHAARQQAGMNDAYYRS